MDLEFKRRERIVGLFLFLVIVLGLSLVVIIGRGKDWFKTYVDYYTEFDESYNLGDNAAVKMAKTKIGKVKGISLSGNRVRVDLAILEEYISRIRKGAVATVESPTLIGSEYVSIRPGPQTASQIPPGGEIDSHPKPSFSDLLAEFQVEKTGKMVVTAVQELTEMVHKLHNPNGPLFSTLKNLDKNMAHLETLLGRIENGEGTLGALMKSDDLAKEVHDGLGHMNSILTAIAEATEKAPGKMDRILENIAGATDKAPEAVEQFQQSLKQLNEVAEKLSRVMDSVRKILVNIEEASNDVPRVSKSTSLGINEMRNTMENVDDVVRSIKQNPLIRGNLPKEPQGEATSVYPRP